MPMMYTRRPPNARTPCKDGKWHYSISKIKLFTAACQIECIIINIVRNVLYIAKFFFLITTGRYAKLALTISTFMAKSAHIANLFVKPWISPCGISAYFFLTDNGLQLVKKVITFVKRFLAPEKITATAYHQRTNVKPSGTIETWSSDFDIMSFVVKEIETYLLSHAYRVMKLRYTDVPQENHIAWSEVLIHLEGCQEVRSP